MGKARPPSDLNEKVFGSPDQKEVARLTDMEKILGELYKE